jgi:hypothetical protein
MVKKYKWFWIWQDESEAAWLGEMSRQGLHLKSPGLFGQYTFERGAPRLFAYYMDFVLQSRDVNDQVRAHQDAGWSHIAHLGSWHYWRRELRDRETWEIHISPTARLEKYQRILGILIIFLPIFIMQLTNADEILNPSPHWGIQAVFFVFYGLFLAYMVALLMTIRQVLRLRRLLKES